MSLGDTNKLHMQVYRIDHSLHNKYKMTKGMFSHTIIDLAHGSLFALHCDNEQPPSPFSGRCKRLDLFKHGGVVFGNDNKLSIGLVFRVVTKYIEVRERTGHIVIRCKD